jgi:hypothetical protein
VADEADSNSSSYSISSTSSVIMTFSSIITSGSWYCEELQAKTLVYVLLASD